MMRWKRFPLAIAIAVAAIAASPPLHQIGEPIGPVPQPEDLVALPGSRWIVAGSMRSRSAPGHLILLDGAAARPAPRILYPSGAAPEPDARFAACPGPLDDSRFTPHGINVARLPDGSFELVAVNHGGRESLEVFHVVMEAGTPRAAWRGCVVLPANASGNGVTAIPGGGFLVTNFLDKSDPDYLGRMERGEATGNVLHWTPAGGWTQALDRRFSGANGIAMSADGRWLYIAEWSARRVWRFAQDGRARPRSIALDFLPDNLRLTSRGTILAAGQRADPIEVMTCKGRGTPCPPGFAVAELTPDLAKANILAEGGSEAFGGATGAILLDRTLWIGSYYGERIVRYGNAGRMP